MQVNGILDFNGIGGLKRVSIVSGDFPANPQVGEFVRKDRKLYLCVDIQDGLPLWCNLVNELTMYRHYQVTPALEWTVNHPLNTNFVIVQVYDALGNQVIPDSINTAASGRVTVTFNTPSSGIVTVVSGETLGLPAPNMAFTEEYSGQIWTVNHNLGYHPSVTVIIGGYVAQPVSVEHTSLNQAVLSFSISQSGTVRCV